MQLIAATHTLNRALEENAPTAVPSATAGAADFGRRKAKQDTSALIAAAGIRESSSSFVDSPAPSAAT